VDFKNVQRRVYDALNVLSAMDIIQKDKYHIIYNRQNPYIPPDFKVSPPAALTPRCRSISTTQTPSQSPISKLLIRSQK
jgi:hypothetical protein